MNAKPVAVSTWFQPIKYFAQFVESAKRNGIELHNADPSTWGGTDWRVIEWWKKSDAQARFVIEHIGEYSHFMFTDSYDCIFAAGWDEILAKFEALQSPIVFGTERYCWPKPEQAEFYPPCPYPTRFLNAGFWMATAEWALKMAVILAELAAKKDRCDSAICVDLFLSKTMPIKLDNKCSLLYCMNMDSPEHLAFDNGRVKALETGENPCVFHGNGSSPLTKVCQWLNL